MPYYCNELPPQRWNYYWYIQSTRISINIDFFPGVYYARQVREMNASSARVKAIMMS